MKELIAVALMMALVAAPGARAQEPLAILCDTPEAAQALQMSAVWLSDDEFGALFGATLAPGARLADGSCWVAVIDGRVAPEPVRTFDRPDGVVMDVFSYRPRVLLLMAGGPAFYLAVARSISNSGAH